MTPNSQNDTPSMVSRLGLPLPTENDAVACWSCHERPRALIPHPFTGEKLKSPYCELCSALPRVAERLRRQA